MYSRKLDGMGGLVSMQALRMKFMTASVTYATIPLVIIVPPGEEFGEIEKFLRPFSIKVWKIVLLYLIILFSVIVTTSIWLPKVYNFVFGFNVKKMLYNNSAVAFGVSISTLPKRNFARYILMILMIYWLILRSAYQGGIFQALKSDIHKPEVSSIQEIVDRKFRFYLYDSLYARAIDFNFYNQSIAIPNRLTNSYALKTLNPSFKGVVFKYLDTILYLNHLNYKNFTFTLCKERFLMTPIVFYFRKHHYLVEEIDQKIELMHMNGLIQHITSRYFNSIYSKKKLKISERKVLILGHFSGLLKIIGILYGLTLLVFLIETLTWVKKFCWLKKKIDFLEC